MILGATSYGFAKKIRGEGMTLPAVMEKMKELGCEHMELSPVTYDLLKDEGLVEEICAASKALSLPISSYTINGNVLRENEDEMKAEVTRLKKHQEICARLGAKRMRHDLCEGRSRGINDVKAYEEAFPTLVRAGKELAQNAEALGIVTSIENHGYFNNGSDRVIALLEAINHPSFRLTLDVGNFMCMDENSVVAVEKCVPYASMVHLKDFYLRRTNKENADFFCSDQVGGWFKTRHGDMLRGAITGQGDLDLPSVLFLVKASGYDGPLSVEFEGFEDSSIGIRMGLNTVRRYWELV